VTERDYHIEGRVVRRYCITYLRCTRAEEARHRGRNREDCPALYDAGEWEVRGRDMLKGVLRTMRETRRMFGEKRREQ
jgi:hypothetical protein